MYVIPSILIQNLLISSWSLDNRSGLILRVLQVEIRCQQGSEEERASKLTQAVQNRLLMAIGLRSCFLAECWLR